MKRAAAKTRWKCTNHDGCVDWLRLNTPGRVRDLDTLNSFIQAPFRLGDETKVVVGGDLGTILDNSTSVLATLKIIF